MQDITEGATSIVVNKQKGVDLRLSSSDLTLNIRDLSERAIRPAMIQLANQIDSDLMALSTATWNWVGLNAPTQSINLSTFTQYVEGPKRLDLSGVPVDQRYGVLSPADQWGFIGSLPAAFMPQIGSAAFRAGSLGTVAGVDNYVSQNVLNFTRGTAATATIGGDASTTYAATLNSQTMSIGLQFTTTKSINAGDVFSIAGVLAVNPVTKVSQGFSQQFVVVANVGGTGLITATISPPIITTGAFQTVSTAAASATLATFFGQATSTFATNLIAHRNALALVMVPMIAPPGAVDVARKSYKGYSVRVIPYYTGSDDDSNYRLDVLYGVKMLDPRAITRLNA